MTKHNSWEKRPFMLTKKPKVIEYLKKKKGVVMRILTRRMKTTDKFAQKHKGSKYEV